MPPKRKEYKGHSSDFGISALFGKTIECDCGKTHHITPERLVYADHVLTHLDGVLSERAGGRRVVVLMDSRTADVAGRAAAQLLRDAGWQTQEILMPDGAHGESPVCDDRTHAALHPQVKAPDVILSIGSGVLSDLGKWIAADRKAPHICFATAASMNGYTSANVAATLDGVKTLLRAQPPRTILADPAILRDAPYEMTAAGLGDVLAKSVSSADWRMNHVLFGDYYCDRSVSLIAEIEPLYTNRPERLLKRRPEAMAALFHGLLLTGVAMTLAESSAPASGGEHLISHTLDMMSSLDRAPHDLHGRQVGVGTILASEIYRRILRTESPAVSPGSSRPDEEFWGALASQVRGHCAEKVERLNRAAEILRQGDRWDQLRAAVKPFLRPPEQIRDCLRRAGAAYRAEDISCSRDRLLTALRHSHEIRSRFTVIDLARMVGVLPQAAAEIIEEWA